MELREQLELVDVQIEDGKATLTFVDKERGEIREVTFNKKSFDQASKKFVDDPEKAEKTEAKVQELFGLEFDKLGQAIGDKRDVYTYDNFNALEEVQVVEKFDKEQVGEMIQTEVSDVKVDDIGIHIFYQNDGKTYRSNMNYAKYLEATSEWFKNPIQEKKQREKFETKFHVSVDNKDELIGKTIMVEVKSAFGRPYGDIKKLPAPKK